MNHLYLRLSAFGILSACSLALLTGCGMGTAVNGPTQLAVGAMRGIVHGGPNPVSGATVTLYQTQTSASTCTTGCSTYGSAGAVLETATTGADGGFSFTTGYTCTSTEYAYVAVTGGHTGTGSATNNQAVLMSALGSCSNLANATAQKATVLFINELSTVASAYALSNFMNVSGSAGAQVVNVGAPYTNNSTPACTVNSTTLATTACVAGGLGHAFANATALVYSVGFGGAVPTGVANTAMPSNTTSVVPQSLLNSLANTLQACVNSTGGKVTSGASDGTNCGNLFFDTVPPGTSTYPTDTLTAAINMAKYPTNNASTIYGLANPQGYFQPSLASSPTDLSLAVFYSGLPTTTACPTSISGTTTSSPITSYSYTNVNTYNNVVYMTLDISDNIYAISNEQSQTLPNVYVDSMTSTGGCNFVSLGDIQPVTNGSTTTQTGVQNPAQLATDTLGQLWISNASSSNNVKQTRHYNTSTGALIGAITGTGVFNWSIAVDRSNNLWVGNAAGNTNGSFTSGTQCFGPEVVGGTATTPTYTKSTTVTPLCNTSTNEGAYNLAIDSYQNIWASNPGPYTSGTTSVSPSAVFVLENQTPAAAATYTTAAISYIANPNNGYKQAQAQSMSGLAVGSSNRAWTPTINSLSIFAPSPTPPTVVTSISSPTTITTTQAKPSNPNFDGNNVLWYGNYDTSSTVSYATSTAVNSLTPCYVASGGTACDYTHAEFGTRAQVDSTGSVWVSVYGNSALTAPAGQSGMLEIIGTAAPAWPQLSWGYPGVKP